MSTGLFGLDQEINLAGRVTTIRKELADNNGHTMRAHIMQPDKPEVTRYWVVIDKQPNYSEMFEVSKADLDYLRGQGVRPEFT